MQFYAGGSKINYIKKTERSKDNLVYRKKCCKKEHILPSDNVQFNEIVQRIGRGEYQAIGRYNGTESYILMYHRTCHQAWTVKAGDFLNGERCPLCKKQHAHGGNGSKSVEYCGILFPSLASLADAVGINSVTLGIRLRRGMSVEAAVELPDMRMRGNQKAG